MCRNNNLFLTVLETKSLKPIWQNIPCQGGSIFWLTDVIVSLVPQILKVVRVSLSTCFIRELSLSISSHLYHLLIHWGLEFLCVNCGCVCV